MDSGGVQFEDFPLEIKKVILSFADDLDRFLFSLVNKTYAALYLMTYYGQLVGEEEIRHNDIHDPFPFRGEGLAIAAAVHGYLNILRMVDKGLVTVFTSKTAAREGHLNILAYLHEVDIHLPPLIVTVAASHNKKDILKWLIDVPKLTPTSNALRGACRHGHFEMVRFLRENFNLEWYDSSLSDACRNNNIEMIKWMMTSKIHSPLNRCVGSAASQGHLDVVIFLRDLALRKNPQEHTEFDQTVTTQSIKHGQLHILEYLFTVDGIPPTEVYYELAARSPKYSVEMADLLYRREIPFFAESIHAAIEQDNIDYLRWADRKKLVEWNTELATFAGRSCRLSILKFLIEEKKMNLPASVMTAACGSYGPDLEVLDMIRYLHKSGVKFENESIDGCISTGRTAVFMWLVNNGCPYNLQSVTANAVQFSNAMIYRWVLDKGHPLQADEAINLCCSVTSTDSQAIIESLIESGFVIPPQTYETALDRWNIALVNWLLEKRIPSPPRFLKRLISSNPDVDLCTRFVKAGAELYSDLYLSALSPEMRKFLDDNKCPIDKFKDSDDLIFQYRFRQSLDSNRYSVETYKESLNYWKGRDVKIPSLPFLFSLREKWIKDGRLQKIVDEANARDVALANGENVPITEEEEDFYFFSRQILDHQRLADEFNDEDVVDLPATLIDTRHEHTLKLIKSPYINHASYSGDNYICNGCRQRGVFYSYHCAECQFDLHPIGCHLSLPSFFNDPSHPHTLKMVEFPYSDWSGFNCDKCGEHGERWSFHCAGCKYDLHAKCVQGDGKGEINLKEKSLDDNEGILKGEPDKMVEEEGHSNWPADNSGEQNLVDLPREIEEASREGSERAQEEPVDEGSESMESQSTDENSYDEGYYSDYFNSSDEDYYY